LRGRHLIGPDPDPSDDPWLTVGEIAAELRINPATVRLWISRGKLQAKRAGQRKLLVQRSELDRMLEASSHRDDNVPERYAPTHPRTAAPRRPVRVRSWSAYSVAKANVPPEVMRAAVKQLQDTGAGWDAALEASENAPPDPGFVGRLRAIADAAGRQHDAIEHAAAIPGFTWKPVPDTEDMILSNELRPGANRPGPERLWDSFDLTVDRLALAMEGNYASLVSTEYRELAWVLREILEVLDPDRSSVAGDDSGGEIAAGNSADGEDQSRA
jgi:excisionase family DNA binding protein